MKKATSLLLSKVQITNNSNNAQGRVICKMIIMRVPMLGCIHIGDLGKMRSFSRVSSLLLGI